MNIVLVDGDAPWVRALFSAMPADISIHALRPRGPARAIRSPLAMIRGWRPTATRWHERAVLVPSWSKVPRLTAAICSWQVRRRIAFLGNDAVIVFTLPFYAPLAEQFPGVPKVYFAYDPYQCYTGWNPAVVESCERMMLTHCDAAFAISPALADDLRKLSDRPVFVQPNGVSESFLAEFDRPLPPPADLPLGGAPVVGCIGQISRAYDWELLTELIPLTPETTYVFVGPLFDEGPDYRTRIDRVFAMPNVRWLGPRPHADLPQYINRFDVCLNPLRVEPCNDRRSLLRLYDYLASDRPIVSTAVASALGHQPYVEIGRTPTELAAMIRRRATGDLQARKSYVRTHTWERRAETFLTNLRSALDARPA